LCKIDLQKLFSIKNNNWFKVLKKLDILQTKVIETIFLNNISVIVKLNFN
jgi:hypothetical protein